ncbi:carboxypeptidase-like regulatory domain-containing protein [Flavobacterium sp. LB3P122]|uniref:carboxypeptidase-like regulatory domain-containing protein n=1 Tax=Flavobacterium algoriphilum TaxID=3398738 RepID=UPI003A8871F8
MKLNKILLLILFFIVTITFGQTSVKKEIRGKISADTIGVEGINIVNLYTENATVTDKNGSFLLFVKEGDVLVFSAVNLVTLHKRISKQDLVQDIIKIQMTPKSIELKEVVVNENSQITAENLGIIPYGQKKYTPAERKLYTATSGGGIDGLLNTISGRKAMLKKEIVVENKEQSLNRLAPLFQDKYYTETLKIAADYIKDFQYYCVDDDNFTAALKYRNKTLIAFLIVGLSEKYNKIITNEK